MSNAADIGKVDMGACSRYRLFLMADIRRKPNTSKSGAFRGGPGWAVSYTHLDVYKRQGVHGHRRFHRRLYGLHAAKRRAEGVFGGRRARAACVEASAGRAGCLHGKDEFPLPDAGADCRRLRLCFRGRFFYFPDKDPASGAAAFKNGRTDGVPCLLYTS